MRKNIELKHRSTQGLTITKAQIARLYELAGIPISQPVDITRVNLELVLDTIEKRLSRTQEPKEQEGEKPSLPIRQEVKPPQAQPEAKPPSSGQVAQGERKPFDLQQLFEQNQPPPKDPRSKSVLIIDDVGMIRYRINKQLSSQGHRVEFARSAEEALNTCRGMEECDIIILDLLIPEEVDGLRLLKALSTDYVNDKTMIIALAPHRCPPETIEMAKRCGAKRVVEKANAWLETLIKISGL